INLVNEIPFVNIPLFNSITIPEKGTVKNEILRVEEFPNYSFSVSNGKVTINPKFKEDGQIEIILTADESLDLSEPIEFQMTVDYKDEFNNLTNTYDIELADEFNLIGSWNVENVDTTRYDTGTASCNGISNQYSTDISIKFNFSEETGVDTTLKTVEEYQNEMCTANGWQGNYEVYTDTVKGYFDWSITGNTLITVYDNGTDSYNNVLNIIDNNNIQITTEDGDVITLTRE
ncbi:hypothetical protein MWU65_07620, partial [Cellulophaga sp. F20128]|uniref:hypothetical protein n=1 Tax=Cellulophaga sp. F20128 TaxID=2926413 RepID=UPI001FF5E548